MAAVLWRLRVEAALQESGMKKIAMIAAVAVVVSTTGAVAQTWQKNWGNGWLRQSCYKFHPPRYPSIGAEAQHIIRFNARAGFMPTKQTLQLEALYLECMKEAGAPE